MNEETQPTLVANTLRPPCLGAVICFRNRQDLEAPSSISIGYIILTYNSLDLCLEITYNETITKMYAH